MSGQEEPDDEDFFKRLESELKAMWDQGWDHPLTKPTLIGAMIGGALGYASFDGAGGWLMGGTLGALAALYIKIKE